MASSEDTAKPAESEKESVTVSVRMSAEDDKLIRRAVVELDTTRSEFMAALAIARAREVLAAHQPLRAS